jgi:hypothetical protein
MRRDRTVTGALQRSSFDDPDIPDAKLAEKALMKEPMARACRDSFAAAVDVLPQKGWLKLPNGWKLAAEKEVVC